MQLSELSRKNPVVHNAWGMAFCAGHSVLLEDTPFVHQRRFQLWDEAELPILQLLLPLPCKTFSIISEQLRLHSNLHQVLYRVHDLNKICWCRRAFSKHCRSV